MEKPERMFASGRLGSVLTGVVGGWGWIVGTGTLQGWTG